VLSSSSDTALQSAVYLVQASCREGEVLGHRTPAGSVVVDTIVDPFALDFTHVRSTPRAAFMLGKESSYKRPPSYRLEESNTISA
jgi:hypothetical protein